MFAVTHYYHNMLDPFCNQNNMQINSFNVVIFQAGAIGVGRRVCCMHLASDPPCL